MLQMIESPYNDDFLLVLNCHLKSISHCFCDIASRSRQPPHPTLHFSENCIILTSAVLSQYTRVTDRRQTDMAWDWDTWFQCLAGQASSYLADDCQLVSDTRPRRLRSSGSLTCAVRRTRNTYGDRCFAAAGPRVWNSLPAKLRQCDSLMQFRRHLKTYFFRDMGPRRSVTLVRQRRIEILLLTNEVRCGN